MTFNPDANALTTLARLKPMLDLQSPSDTSQDTVLQALIDGASNYFLSLLNRPNIYTLAYTKTFNGNGRRRMLLPDYPVTAVSAVTIGATAVPQSTAYGMAGFLFDTSSVMLVGFSFCKGYQNVTISYTAGYPALDATNGPQHPDMLAMERGVLALVASWWKRKAHWDEQDVVNMTGITQRFMGRDVPPETATAVRQFARVAPMSWAP